MNGLRDRWILWRNRLLLSPGFQRFSKAFPPVRPIVRSRSKALFDILAGFTYSQILFACVKLDLIEMLAAGPKTLDEIAARIGWPRDHAARLLKAAQSLQLVDSMSDRCFTLGMHGAALKANPWIGKFVQHHHLLYKDLEDPIALLSGAKTQTELGSYWKYAKNSSPHGADADAYTALMAASQAAVAEEILAAYDFSKHRILLDIGGGDGSFIRAVAERHPKLEFILFDLPEVIEIARKKFPEGFPVRFVAGSFHVDPLPEGADVVTLVRVLHDHDDDKVTTMMRKVSAKLTTKNTMETHAGTLLIAEPLSGQPAIAAVTDVYFNSYFAAMGQGRTRSFEELAAIGKAAGFATAKHIPTRLPLMTGLAIMKK